MDTIVVALLQLSACATDLVSNRAGNHCAWVPAS